MDIICEPTVGGDLPLPCSWRAPNHRGGWQAGPLRPSWRSDARRQDSHGPGHLSRTHSSPALPPSPPACAALTKISLPDVLSSPALRSLFPAWCTTQTSCSNNQMGTKFLLFSSLRSFPLASNHFLWNLTTSSSHLYNSWAPSECGQSIECSSHVSPLDSVTTGFVNTTSRPKRFSLI